MRKNESDYERLATKLARKRKPQVDRQKINERLCLQWPGMVENWSKGFVTREFWRVKVVLQSTEDALQECAVVFTKIIDHYGANVDNPAWLFALYKVALKHEFDAFAIKDRQLRASHEQQLPTQQVDFNQGPLMTQVRQTASSELRAVIATIANGPVEVLATFFAVDKITRSDTTRDKAESRSLCRAAGVREVNILAELRSLLKE